MVSSWSIVFMVMSLLLSLIIPIAGWIYMKRSYRIDWKPVLVGVAIFIVFSQLLESILNGYVLQGNDVTSEWLTNPYLYALYGALAAGVFEEVGRYVGFRLILTPFRDWKDGIAYGIGHGGIEAILVGAIASVQSIIVAVMINTGQFADMLQSMGDASLQLQVMQDQLTQAPAYMFFLVGVERLLTFALQLALSLMVLYSVSRSRIRFLFYAILIHTAVNFISIMLTQAFQLNGLIAEIFLLIVALASLRFIKRSKRLFSDSADAQ
ncbi:YhfC family intramembrane metalloprotease [Barrientosiimonas marina]|uniref:YhfC family intramembrane metalloprotease n=1 Tax=Lentibacillus kimchii TaxID=1542911 RepID=A0ABW2UXF1_9BACI